MLHIKRLFSSLDDQLQNSLTRKKSVCFIAPYRPDKVINKVNVYPGYLQSCPVSSVGTGGVGNWTPSVKKKRKKYLVCLFIFFYFFSMRKHAHAIYRDF